VAGSAVDLQGLEFLRLSTLPSDPENQAVLELSLPAGSVWEPEGQEGISAIWAAVLTVELGAVPGVRVMVWAEPDRAAIRLVGEPGPVAAGFGEVVSRLLDPKLDPETVQREARSLSAMLSAELLDPEALGARVFTSTALGDHPYARLETPAGYEAVDREDLLRFHRARVGLRGSRIIAAGLRDESLEALERHVLRWAEASAGAGRRVGEPSPVPALPGAVERDLSGRIPIQLVHAPGLTSVSLLVGHPLEPVPDTLWMPLALGVEMQAIANFRTMTTWPPPADGAPRSASDGSATRLASGAILQARARIHWSRAGQALQLLLESLDRMGEHVPPPDRVAAVTAGVAASGPSSLPLEARVAQISAYSSVGLGPDFWGDFSRRVASVDGFQARDALSGRVSSAGATVVAVGDAALVEEALSEFGPVTLVDPRGNSMAALDDLLDETAPLPLVSSPVRGRWTYRFLVADEEVGRAVREVSSGPDSLAGSLVVRSSLEVGPFVQEARVLADGATLETRSAELESRGDPVPVRSSLEIVDERVRGTVEDEARGYLREVSEPAPQGLLAGDALEVALWNAPLEPGATWSVPFLDPASGSVVPAWISVVGLTEVRLGGGREPHPAWSVEVVARGVRQRLFISDDAPRRTLAAELVGQPIRMELEMDGPGGAP
jgi:hypothetical protein